MKEYIMVAAYKLHWNWLQESNCYDESMAIVQNFLKAYGFTFDDLQLWNFQRDNAALAARTKTN